MTHPESAMNLAMKAQSRADRFPPEEAWTTGSHGHTGVHLAIEPKLEPIAADEADAAPGTPARGGNPEAGLAGIQIARPAPNPGRGLRLSFAILGLAAAGIVAYISYQIHSLTEATASQPAPAPAPSPASAALPPLAVAPAASSAPSVPTAQAAQQPPRRYPIEAPSAPAAVRPPAEPVAESGVPIRLVRSRPEIDPHLRQGYLQLEAGNLGAARSEYEQAYGNDPRNIDALLGLAVLAQQDGRAADAESYYRQALEANPKDATAQAAAIVHSPAGDQVAIESRIKNLLAAQPESGPLNFSLGNLYSRQNRWSEAQQMYFNAVASDGDNPDYLFNLAVSLDHIRQPRLAARQYHLALQAADRRPAAFDRKLANKRLQDLQ